MSDRKDKLQAERDYYEKPQIPLLRLKERLLDLSTLIADIYNHEDARLKRRGFRSFGW